MSGSADLLSIPQFAGKNDDEVCSIVFRALLQRQLQDAEDQRRALQAQVRRLTSEREELVSSCRSERREKENLALHLEQAAKYIQHNRRLQQQYDEAQQQLHTLKQKLTRWQELTNKLIDEKEAMEEKEDASQQRIEAADARIEELQDQLQLERHLMDTTLRCAVDVIEEHGPLVGLPKFSNALYDADKRAKPALGGRRMLEWLRSMPHIFELHGEGQSGHERVSLRGSAQRPLTQAGLQAIAASSPGAGPSGLEPPEHQGSDVAGSTSDKTTSSVAEWRALRGLAAELRDYFEPGSYRRKELNFIVHSSDSNPHSHGRNPFVDESGRPKLEDIKATINEARKESKTARRARSVPRSRPSTGADEPDESSGMVGSNARSFSHTRLAAEPPVRRLRFAVGDRVECANGNEWETGVVTQLHYVHQSLLGQRVMPYLVRLDSGENAALPDDVDSAIRQAEAGEQAEAGPTLGPGVSVRVKPGSLSTKMHDRREGVVVAERRFRWQVQMLGENVAASELMSFHPWCLEVKDGDVWRPALEPEQVRLRRAEEAELFHGMS